MQIDEERETITGDNYYRDSTGCVCFTVNQRYMIPVNAPEVQEDGEEGTVSAILIQVEAGTRILPFFWNFRRLLRSLNIPPVYYCWAADLQEILQCGELPEVK